MRIRFKKADLLPAAAIVQGVASPQSTLPILSNVLITAEHDNLATFTATDYETRVRIEVAADVEKKGSTTVPAKTFYDLVKELPENEDVLLDVREKGATIRCRDIRVELACVPARDFPKWPDVEELVSFDMEQKKLKQVIDKVKFAIPVRDPRKVLLGAQFEFKAGGLNAVATDGKVLAFMRIPVEAQEVPKDYSVIIHHKLLEELHRSLADEGSCHVAFDERQVAFQFGNVLYVSNQIEGRYPNYDAVVPKTFARELRFQRPPMLAAIRRASILSDIKSNAITLIFSGDRVKVEAESFDRGTIEEEIPAVTDGEDMTIMFNYRFMLEALKVIDQEEIVLQVNHPSTPSVLCGDQSPDNYYLIMPIKLTDLKDYEATDDDQGIDEEESEPSPDYEE